MNAPIRYLQCGKIDGRVWVLVGKSDFTREVVMTDRERLQLLDELSHWAALRFAKAAEDES